MNSRVKELRKCLDKTQEEFALSVGCSRSVIKNIESGITDPKGPFIDLVCRTYNVSKEWLMTGEGEMFLEKTDDEILAEEFGSILSDCTDPEKRRAVMGLLELMKVIPPEYYSAIADFAEKITKK